MWRLPGARLSQIPETPGMEAMKDFNWSVALRSVGSSSWSNA